MKWIKKHTAAFFLLLCYGAGLLALLGVQLFGFVQNRVLYANGTFATQQLSLADFELHELVERDGVLVTTGADPQMRLKDATLRVDSVTVEWQAAEPPRTQTAFYAKAGEGEPAYSVRRMVYARTGGGASVFWLPPTGGESLRIDPDTKPGNAITIHSITLNRPRPFWAFFVPGAAGWAAFAVCPGLAACALWALREGLRARRERRKGAGR